jgi:hypothetical protein
MKVLRQGREREAALLQCFLVWELSERGDPGLDQREEKTAQPNTRRGHRRG